jgi:hypothetical protein
MDLAFPHMDAVTPPPAAPRGGTSHACARNTPPVAPTQWVVSRARPFQSQQWWSEPRPSNPRPLVRPRAFLASWSRWPSERGSTRATIKADAACGRTCVLQLLQSLRARRRPGQDRHGRRDLWPSRAPQPLLLRRAGHWQNDAGRAVHRPLSPGRAPRAHPVCTAALSGLAVDHPRGAAGQARRSVPWTWHGRQPHAPLSGAVPARASAVAGPRPGASCWQRHPG